MKRTEIARKIIFVCSAVCCAGCCIFLLVWFFNGQQVKARNLGLAAQFHAEQTATAQPDSVNPIDLLRRQNEDTVGWVSIDGTSIDYPVVQGSDNSYYLNNNFWKQEDRYGAIFMDCANTEGFESRHTILYGHNMKDGAMFGGLPQYLNVGYLAAHPLIDVILPDGGTVSYRIFSIRKTDAYDSAYRKDFADESEFEAFASELGSPDTSAPLLTLSTCTNGADYTERVLVHAARVQ